jgi:hypothetical protein
MRNTVARVVMHKAIMHKADNASNLPVHQVGGREIMHKMHNA